MTQHSGRLYEPTEQSFSHGWMLHGQHFAPQVNTCFGLLFCDVQPVLFHVHTGLEKVRFGDVQAFRHAPLLPAQAHGPEAL